MMSRKNYEAIAGAIRLAAKDPRLSVVADNLADVLAKDNPNFDKARFMEAALGGDA